MYCKRERRKVTYLDCLDCDSRYECGRGKATSDVAEKPENETKKRNSKENP